MHNWESTILSLTDTIENAIHTLNKSGMQIVLVLDNLGKLRGTITDGDVPKIFAVCGDRNHNDGNKITPQSIV